MAHRAIVKHRRRDLSSLHDVGLRFRFAPQVVSLEALVIVRRNQTESSPIYSRLRLRASVHDLLLASRGKIEILVLWPLRGRPHINAIFGNRLEASRRQADHRQERPPLHHTLITPYYQLLVKQNMQDASLH